MAADRKPELRAGNAGEHCWPALDCSVCPRHLPMVEFSDWCGTLASVSAGHFEEGKGIRGPGGEVVSPWFDGHGDPPGFVARNIEIVRDILAGVMTWSDLPDTPVRVRKGTQEESWEWRRPVLGPKSTERYVYTGG